MKNVIIKNSARAIAVSAISLSSYFLIVPQEGEKVNKQGEHIAYQDSVGVWTACWGKTGLDLRGNKIQRGSKYTTEDCDKMLSTTVEEISKQVNSLVKVEWQSPYQEAAVISFVYNVGIGAFKNSTMLRMLNQGQYVAACNQLPKWVYGTVKGKKTVLNGLVTRRNIEKDWCLGNVPSNIEYRIDEFIKSLPKDSLNYVEGVDTISNK